MRKRDIEKIVRTNQRFRTSADGLRLAIAEIGGFVNGYLRGLNDGLQKAGKKGRKK